MEEYKSCPDQGAPMKTRNRVKSTHTHSRTRPRVQWYLPMQETTIAVYRISFDYGNKVTHRTQDQSGGNKVSISDLQKFVGKDMPHPLDSHRKIKEGEGIWHVPFSICSGWVRARLL